jgi:hypothetical protein
MSKFKRKQWLVDKQVQKGIIVRQLVYWALCMLFITLPLAIFQTWLEPEQMLMAHAFMVWKSHWPVFLTLTCLLPFGMYDIMRFSNRFAGPIYRLRRELRAFAETGSMRSIKFRDHDFWTDLADGVNLLTARIESLEQQLSERNLSGNKPARELHCATRSEK